nr:DUF4105 domain-containing protein [Burkholderia cenocepacia]
MFRVVRDWPRWLNVEHRNIVTERRVGWLSSLIRRRRREGPWVPEYARTTRIEQQGTKVTILNVRNFTYRTRDDGTPTYYDATYDIEAVESVDLVVSRWTAESIAHVFLSFGFRDGRYLAISIETRRRQGQRYSPYAGFLPLYDLIYVVADERDLIGVRTDVRRERVHLFRADIEPATAQALFADYLRRVDALDRCPEFYNTLFNNCTTNILHHVRAVAPEIGYSWKVLLSGYADRYSYELGLLGRTLPFEALKAGSLIRRPAGSSVGDLFSKEIRDSLYLAEAVP